MSTSSIPPELPAGADALGVALTSAQLLKLGAYAALLGKWNKTYNLTALRDLERVVPLHLLDSLSVAPYLNRRPLLDVGSGGGLPGIPLAIAMPGLAVTLLDSNSKKSAFQQQAAIELSLTNVKVINGRVENCRPAGRFGQIVSRAFSEMADFVSATRSLLEDGGCWLAMKGIYPEEEISRLPPGVVVQAVHRLEVPGVAGERHLVILREA